MGGWAVATMLALVLGLQGIRSVSNSVTNTRPAPLSPASVKAAVQRTGALASTSASTESDTPADSTQGQSSASSGAERGTAGVSTDDRTGGPTPPPGPASSGDTSGELPASSSNPSGPGGDDGSSSSQENEGASSSSSSASSAAPQDKTYQLIGGSVGIRFEDGAAHLLWATPNSGFSVETSNDGGTVDVRFRSDDHESRLRAYWDNGPQQQIEENNDGG